MIGTTISQYRILERLGQGGMGEVYLALDTHLNRKVALKFLLKDSGKDPSRSKRLLHEARAAAVLDHPFICKIYQAVDSEDHDFIAMEYVEGKTLRDVLQEGPLPLKEVMRIALEIAEALEVAHERGIVHRDLKPGNIMLGRGGHIKIMDFGLAKQVGLPGTEGDQAATTSGISVAGAIVGTLEYMSPEQLRGLDVDARTDIFSLGLVLCELLTGQQPLRRSLSVDTAGALLSPEPVPLPRHSGSSTPFFSHVLRRMLEKDRNNRYQSTKDLIAELQLVKVESVSSAGRRLAAIMFTDLVGYSAATQRDESLAMQLLEEHRRLARPVFSKYEGEEIKTIGDAFLVEFSSALNAAKCAIEIQKSLFERNQVEPPERQIQMRVGIHLGDVIHQEGDVFGEGVNIAARMEPLAVAGGICVSDDVAHQIHNKLDYALQEIPNPKFKHGEAPVRVFRILLPWNAAAIAALDAGELVAERRPEPARAQAPMRFRGKFRILAAAGLVVAIVAAGLVWYMISPPRTALGFEERDWIVVAEVENSTGEAVFDKSLDTALRVSLEQSSYVNVLPKSRIEATLRRMEKSTTARLDEPLAREIAQREGIKIILIPSITGVGGTYILATTLEDAGNGARLVSESVRVHGREEVLGAVDKLSRYVRTNLGESRSAISKQGKELAKVTTPSLDALKQFSLGVEAHLASKFDEARSYYENAVLLDPNFAAAVASLGMINFERFDPEKGKKLLAQAVQLADKLTDREKYGIMAFYARAVENNIPKAIQQWKALSSIYPDDAVTHNNLAWYYMQVGSDQEAIAEYKEALRIDQYLMVCYNGLSIIYLFHTGEVSAAIPVCLKSTQLYNKNHWGYDYLGWAYLGTGEYAQAGAAFEKALQYNPNPRQQVPGLGNIYEIDLYRLAHSLRLQKKYPQALSVLQRLPQVSSDPVVDYEMGVVSQLMNDRAGAMAHFERYYSYLTKRAIPANPKNSNNYFELALVAQRMGRSEEAQAAFQKAVAMNPEEHFGAARFYSLRGNADEALRELEAAIQKGFRNYVWIKINPDFQNLYDNPRFQAMLKQYIR